MSEQVETPTLSPEAEVSEALETDVQALLVELATGLEVVRLPLEMLGGSANMPELTGRAFPFTASGAE